jgi:hypothetical protein
MFDGPSQMPDLSAINKYILTVNASRSAIRRAYYKELLGHDSTLSLKQVRNGKASQFQDSEPHHPSPLPASVVNY